VLVAAATSANRQRRERHAALSGEPQRHAARHQQRETGSGLEQSRQQRDGGAALVGTTEPESRGDRARHESVVVDALEAHERDLVTGAGTQTVREFEREARLPDPTRTDQGHEADGRIVQQVGRLRQLALAAEERSPHARHGRAYGLHPRLGQPVEALGEQRRQVHGHQVTQLVGVVERAVTDAVVGADAAEQRVERRFAPTLDALHVDELRTIAGAQVLVLEPGDALARRDPTVAVGVHADEDVALVEVGAVQVA